MKKLIFSKLYEYTTSDYSKGYFFARNEKSAVNKISKRNVSLIKDARAISHYNNVNKKTLKSKYKNYNSWNIERW